MRQKDLFTWAQMVSGDSQLKHNFGTKAYGPFALGCALQAGGVTALWKPHIFQLVIPLS